MTPDYSHITEVPGLKASLDQLEKARHRYCFAKKFSKGKEVLEVACGSGMGLGYLAQEAKAVTGGDIDETNLSFAHRHYKGRQGISILKLDAHQLPFPDKSFDTVILFEAIYYLQHPEKFAEESRRLLRKDGTLIIGSVNREWSDFHLSPFAVKYFSAKELYEMLKSRFEAVTIYGAFPVEKGLKARIISFIKQAAMKFNLIPGGLKARAYLKRIFIGRLVKLPAELSGESMDFSEPVKLSPGSQVKDFKILYAVAQNPKS
jgi:ubiquinone/menaquinone biosynthesis C-methylase UbiE